ncbi:unnamed protein product [Owenia fusiformis]|uniref:Uncharacterized protein n=1 Tax=Owenia fusiformis TaxID=6347 RepID=A0A8J1TX62_OWEFU|nr:unnamed protein product [Owenia fusiformis]
MDNTSYTLIAPSTAVTTELANNTPEIIPGPDERYPHHQFLGIFLPYALLIDRLVTPIWYIIGAIGNTLSAKVWLEKRIRSSNSSAIYLATLAISDLLFLMLHILVDLKYAWGFHPLKYPVLCEVFFVLYLVPQYLSPLLVLGFTIERYIAVCHPFKKERYCTPQTAQKAIICLVVSSVLLCVVQAWFWTYSDGACVIRAKAIEGQNASIWSVWTWSTEIIIFMLVPLTILLFNILVIQEIKRLRRMDLIYHQEHHKAWAATTVMLLSVSFYVIFTTLPATLVYSMTYVLPERTTNLTDAQIRTDSSWQGYFSYLMIRKIVEEICLSHYACNIFIYLVTGIQFRTALANNIRCVMNSLKGIKHVNNYNQVPGRNDNVKKQKTMTSIDIASTQPHNEFEVTKV